MSKIHFIDTSVFVELLDVPHLNTKHNEAVAEYRLLDENGDIFILPVATVVETGNHIAHIPDGNTRRLIAEKFVEIVKEAIKQESSWNIVPEIPVDVLEHVLSTFPDQAMQKTGFGDLSIIEQFNDYWEHKQPIGEMRIWSFDKHLSSYHRTGGLSRRKFK